MITNTHRENVISLVRQGHKPLLDIIEAYKAKEDVTDMLAEWRGFGTTGEAINEYLEKHVTQKTKRSTKKMVVNNGSSTS